MTPTYCVCCKSGRHGQTLSSEYFPVDIALCDEQSQYVWLLLLLLLFQYVTHTRVLHMSPIWPTRTHTVHHRSTWNQSKAASSFLYREEKKKNKENFEKNLRFKHILLMKRCFFFRLSSHSGVIQEIKINLSLCSVSIISVVCIFSSPCWWLKRQVYSTPWCPVPTTRLTKTVRLIF